jgi:hypothetical protein
MECLAAHKPVHPVFYCFGRTIQSRRPIGAHGYEKDIPPECQVQTRCQEKTGVAKFANFIHLNKFGSSFPFRSGSSEEARVTKANGNRNHSERF